jgi:hypothetical protein
MRMPNEKDRLSKQKEEQKERVKIVLFYPFKNRWRSSLSSIFLFALFYVLNRIQPNPYNLLLYFLAIMLLLPYVSDVAFYESFFDARDAVKKLLKDASDLNLEIFQKKYNKLRKSLRKRIVSSSGNILTYDYEIGRIVHNIDTFFDATLRILFRKKVMSIPYSPHDEATEYMVREKIWIQQPLDEEPQDLYEAMTCSVKEVNFVFVDEFLRFFGDVAIKKPRTRGVNTVAIGEFFSRWNSMIETVDPKIFAESKGDVEKYYDEKRERRGLLLEEVFKLSFTIVLGLIIGVIAQIIP